MSYDNEARLNSILYDFEIEDLNLLYLFIDNEDYKDEISQIINYNFDKIPESDRNNLISKLLEYNDYKYDIYHILILKNNYLPDYIKDQLFEIATISCGTISIPLILKANFKNIDNDIRDKLINIMYKEDLLSNSSDFISLIIINYNEIPDYIRENLLISDNINYNNSIIYDLIYNYQKLPDKDREIILYKIINSKELINYTNKSSLMDFLLVNYKILPEKVKNLFNNSINEFVNQRDALHKFAMYFKYLPREYRENLFTKLSDIENSDYFLFRIIIENYQELSKDITDKIHYLSEKVDIWAKITFITENYNNLPFEIKNILDKEIEKESSNKDLIEAIIKNYNKLPLSYTNILKDFSNEKRNYYICDSLTIYFSNVSENEAIQIVKSLSEVNPIPNNFPLLLLANYNILPKQLTNLIFNYSKDNKLYESVSEGIISYNQDLTENIINLIFNIIEDFEITDIILYLLDQKFDSLSYNIRNSLLDKIADKNVNPEYIEMILNHYHIYIPEYIKTKLLKILSLDNQF